MSPSKSSSAGSSSVDRSKFDAQKASGRVVRHLEEELGDEIVIIGPSAEYQGTRIGWWTVRVGPEVTSSDSEAQSFGDSNPNNGPLVIEWALWSRRGTLRLSLRLPGGSGQPRKVHSAKSAALQVLGALSGMKLLCGKYNLTPLHK